MRGLAPILALIKFAVALPDARPVPVGRMPCLDSEPAATVAALELCTEDALAAVCPAYGFPAFDLVLHCVPLQRINDRLVAVFDIVLRYFALVDFPLLR